MGCNCGKPTPPTGAKPKPGSDQTPAGGLAGQTQSFTLITSNGKTQKFQGSMLEAQAAIVRAGGGSIRPN